jgi:hypothetical protein
MQIDKLVDLPVIREVTSLPLVSSLIAGFLPQLVLRLFYSLMPYILALLERMAGLPAESEVEWGVVRKYFAFQVRAVCLLVGEPSLLGCSRCSVGCHGGPWLVTSSRCSWGCHGGPWLVGCPRCSCGCRGRLV